MIAISFQSATAYLIDDAPHWGASIELRARLPLHVETGLTQREARRAVGDSLRLSLSYDALLQDVAPFRNVLQALDTERVLCPLWPYRFDAGATPIVTAAYYVCLGDGSAPEIKTHAQLPFARQAYPMMVGRFAQRPDPTLFHDELGEVTIDFEESDVWPITPPAYSPPSGLTAGGSTRPLWPWRPNWASRPHSGHADVEVDRQQIGEGRASADAYYEQLSRRDLEHFFTLQGNEVWQLLRLFLDWRAGASNFWLPAGIGDARLTADVSAIATQLAVDKPSNRGTNAEYVLDDLVNRRVVKVTGTAGSNWTLSAAVGQAFTAAQTRIESLVLARLRSPELRISFQSAEVATATVRFREVPTEIATPAGETAGSTIGALADTAWLYTFRIDYPDASLVWRFTDFERDVTESGNTYLSKPMEHDSIREGLNLERQQTTLKSRAFTDNPLMLLIPFRLEWPLQVEIAECNVSGSTASNVKRYFVGEVEEPELDGPYLRVVARSLGALFERKVPRILFQRVCNAVLFDTECGLNKDDWKWQGTVTSFDAATGSLVLGSVTRVSGGAITLVADFFAGGYLYFGSGTAAQYRMVSSNAAASGSNITLRIGSPLTTAPGAGATVFFHPGCNGRYTVCHETFNNRARFRGFPFLPHSNPSGARVNGAASVGGKKA